MQSAIIAKLEKLLANGIQSESDALYLLAETRKLLEHLDAKKQYDYLTFHCDWALHAKLSGPTAQRILKLFDKASAHLKAGVKLDRLPISLRMEIDRISKMRYFEQQLESFLESNGIPTLESTRVDGWTHFVHFYAQIVEDCPLVIKAKNASGSIDSVTLQLELATRLEHGEMFFKVRWIVEYKSGPPGEIYVIHSFSANPDGRHARVLS